MANNFSDFKYDVAAKLKNENYHNRSYHDLINFPILHGKQCLYVMDWKQSKITYSRGVKEMLGYDEEEFTMNLALNYFHPDDRNFVDRIIKGIVSHSINNNVSGPDQYLNLTFRLRQKDGTYKKVLRKSKAFEVSSDNHLISNFSLLTDIDFISNGNKVEWDIYTHELDIEGFKKNVHKTLNFTALLS